MGGKGGKTSAGKEGGRGGHAVATSNSTGAGRDEFLSASGETYRADETVSSTSTGSSSSSTGRHTK